MVQISVLIINYNTAQLVMDCVHSLLNQRDMHFEIIVVDNCSADDSVAQLKTLGDRIRLIANKDNKGFGAANNQAFQSAQGRYLFLLNPDAACQSDHDLKSIWTYMEQHPETGLIGTGICDNEGHLLKTAYDHYPHQAESTLDAATLPGSIATVLGASMVIRADLYRSISGFDERFFLYAEETDLCLRIRQAGYKIDYLPSVVVSHVGGASERKNPPREVLQRKKKGKILFYLKHYQPHAVRKILRHELRQAKWHLWRLNFLRNFKKWSDKNQRKVDHAEVTIALANEYLPKIPI